MQSNYKSYNGDNEDSRERIYWKTKYCIYLFAIVLLPIEQEHQVLKSSNWLTCLKPSIVSSLLLVGSHLPRTITTSCHHYHGTTLSHLCTYIKYTYVSHACHKYGVWQLGLSCRLSSVSLVLTRYPRNVVSCKTWLSLSDICIYMFRYKQIVLIYAHT